MEVGIIFCFRNLLVKLQIDNLDTDPQISIFLEYLARKMLEEQALSYWLPNDYGVFYTNLQEKVSDSH